MITQPMLAATCNDISTVKFPVLATPKLDGIRCLKINGKALSRTFKPIANPFVREWIEANVPDGCDGELTVKGRAFHETSGDIARTDGEPDFVYSVFDYVKDGIDKPYSERIADLRAMCVALDDLHGGESRVVAVMPSTINCVQDLMVYETGAVAEGYEGVMIRTPDSPYKCGRSTAQQGWLLKIKRFEDAEATVIGFVEGYTNNNPAETDAFGRTKRSLSKAGKVGNGTLGAFVVLDDEGREFRVSGFNRAFATEVWQNQEAYVGRIVKYKHQPSGAFGLPRFPKFVGIREQWDM
jgi:DNA ligase-1